MKSILMLALSFAFHVSPSPTLQDMRCTPSVDSMAPFGCNNEWVCSLRISNLQQNAGPDCDQCEFSLHYKLKCTKPGVGFAYIEEGDVTDKTLPCPDDEPPYYLSSMTFNCPGGGSAGFIEFYCYKCEDQG